MIILSVGGVALIVDPDELAQGQGSLPKLNLIAAAAAITQASTLNELLKWPFNVLVDIKF